MRLGIPSELSQLLGTGLLRSIGSLTIKVATAGLTYVTYVVLSRTMTQTEYGHFAFGLALATVLAIAAAMGQPTAILRFWPEAMVANKRDMARRAVRSGTTLIILAALAIVAGLALMVFVASHTMTVDDTTNHLYGAAFLVLPMALAEFYSAALRAQGSVWTALLPRDILWRLAVPIAVIGLYAMGIVLSGADALVLTAALLIGALALQYWIALRAKYELRMDWGGTAEYWAQNGAISRWLLLGALIETAALNVDVILLGLLDNLDNSAIYFNAFRTAGLMTLISYSIVLVIAPMITRSFYANEMRKAQLLASASVWVGFSFSLLIFLCFVLFGDQILLLFGPGYSDGKLILVLLAVGLLVDAATGPSRTLMMTTGHERSYVYAMGGITLVSLIVQVLVLPAYGMVGLALVNMLARLVSQAFMAIWCVRFIGIDPTIFSILRLLPKTVARPTN
jgi:O-antigen/teichoic acid export membrane protein